MFGGRAEIQEGLGEAGSKAAEADGRVRQGGHGAQVVPDRLNAGRGCWQWCVTSGLFWEGELDPLPLLAPYFVGLGNFVTKKKS